MAAILKEKTQFEGCFAFAACQADKGKWPTSYSLGETLKRCRHGDHVEGGCQLGG